MPATNYTHFRGCRLMATYFLNCEWKQTTATVRTKSSVAKLQIYLILTIIIFITTIMRDLFYVQRIPKVMAQS